ncbi:MAG: 4Fe-4S binding protein [bacterium]
MEEKKTGRRRGKLFFALWHWLLFIAGIALIVQHNLAAPEVRIKRHPAKEEIKKAINGSIHKYQLDDPIDHTVLRLTSGDGPTSAACVATAELPPEVKGYVDEINTMVVVDKTGTIRTVRILAHRETPPYMRKILRRDFLEKFVGRNVKEDLQEIDTVTGASITADAIKEDVLQASRLAAARVFQVPVETADVPGWADAMASPAFIAVFFALAISLYARLGKWPEKGRKETAWILSILIIGVYAMTPFTLVHLFQLLELSVPGPGSALVLLLAAYVFIATVLFGPVWCSYACPFGALQELLSRIPLKRWKVSPAVMLYAREIRYAVLFICVLGAFGLGEEAFAMVEPRGHLFGRTDMVLAWVFIVAVLFTSVFVKRFWCRFFCPTGACLVILSSHRKLVKQVRKGLDESGIDQPDESGTLQGEALSSKTTDRRNEKAEEQSNGS